MVLKILALLLILVSSADLACLGLGIESRKSIRPARDTNQTHPDGEYLPLPHYSKRSPAEELAAFIVKDDVDIKLDEDDYKEEYVASDEEHNAKAPQMKPIAPMANKPEPDKEPKPEGNVEAMKKGSVTVPEGQRPPAINPPQKLPYPDSPAFPGSPGAAKGVKPVFPPKDFNDDYKTSDEAGQIQDLPDLPPPESKPEEVQDDDSDKGIISTKKKNKMESTKPEDDPGFGYPPFPGGFPGADFDEPKPKPVVPPEDLKSDEIDQFDDLPQNPFMMTLSPLDVEQTTPKVEEPDDNDGVIQANRKKNKIEAMTTTVATTEQPDDIDQFQSLPELTPSEKPEDVKDDDSDRIILTNKKKNKLDGTTITTTMNPTTTSGEPDQEQSMHLDPPFMAHPENVSGVDDTDSDDLIEANRKKNKKDKTGMTDQPNMTTTTELPETSTTTTQLPEGSVMTILPEISTTRTTSTTTSEPTNTTEELTTTAQSTTTNMGYGYEYYDDDSDDSIHPNKKKNKMATTLMTELPTTPTEESTIHNRPEGIVHGCTHIKSNTTHESPSTTSSTTTAPRKSFRPKPPRTKPPRTKPPRTKPPPRQHYNYVENIYAGGGKGDRAESLEEIAHDAGKPFIFKYGIRDGEGNDYSHASNSNGDIVLGEYRTLMADGRTQIVSYTADWKHGYRARVQYLRPTYYRHKRTRRSLKKKKKFLKQKIKKFKEFGLKVLAFFSIKNLLYTLKKSRKSLQNLDKRIENLERSLL